MMMMMMMKVFFYRSFFIDSLSLRSPLVSRTLLSILAGPESVEICVLSSFLPVPSFPSLFYRLLRDSSEGINNKLSHSHLHVSHLFQFSSKIQVFVNLFVFFHFPFVVPLKNKIHQMTSFFLKFLLINTEPELLVGISWSMCIFILIMATLFFNRNSFYYSKK